MLTTPSPPAEEAKLIQIMRAPEMFQALERGDPNVKESVNYFLRIATANLIVDLDGKFKSTDSSVPIEKFPFVAVCAVLTPHMEIYEKGKPAKEIRVVNKLEILGCTCIESAVAQLARRCPTLNANLQFTSPGTSQLHNEPIYSIIDEGNVLLAAPRTHMDLAPLIYDVPGLRLCPALFPLLYRNADLGGNI